MASSISLGVWSRGFGLRADSIQGANLAKQECFCVRISSCYEAGTSCSKNSLRCLPVMRFRKVGRSDISLQAGDPDDRTLNAGSSIYWVPFLTRIAAPPRALSEGCFAYMRSYPLMLEWDLGEKLVSDTSSMSFWWAFIWCSTMALLF